MPGFRVDGADVLSLATGLRRPDGVGQAKRLKDMEHENTRLKKLVAKLSLDNATLTYNSGPVAGWVNLPTNNQSVFLIFKKEKSQLRVFNSR